jgi:hypothetical protein
VHTVKRNSGSELRRALQAAFPTVPVMDDEVVREAIVEIEQAIERAVSDSPSLARQSQAGKLSQPCGTQSRNGGSSCSWPLASWRPSCGSPGRPSP